MIKPGTYGTVVLPGVAMSAPGIKTANGYVIVKGGEPVTLFHGDVADFIPAVEWEPTRWWRAVGLDGVVWIESSDEEEVRRESREGDRIENLWQTVSVREWRPA